MGGVQLIEKSLLDLVSFHYFFYQSFFKGFNSKFELINFFVKFSKNNI